MFYMQNFNLTKMIKTQDLIAKQYCYILLVIKSHITGLPGIW